MLKLIGEKSGTEDDAQSTAECPEGTVLVNCEIILGSDKLYHDGVKIKDGKICVLRIFFGFKHKN